MGTISKLGNMTGDIGKPSSSTLQMIKSQASKHPQLIRSKTYEAAGKTSSRARRFSQEAVKLSLSNRSVKQGKIYAAPQ